MDHYTHHLSALLKKKPPEWNADHTFAVTTNGIFGNSNLQNFPPSLADPESPTGSSGRNLPPLENSNESNQADVSSAREKATMPKIAPTKEKNPSG